MVRIGSFNKGTNMKYFEYFLQRMQTSVRNHLPKLLAVLCASFVPTAYFSAQAANCKYKVDPSTAKLTWTGYKFTEKTGVSGTFDSIDVQQTEASSAEAVIESVKFRIDTASVNSQNPERDEKLALYIFGALVDPGSISGSVGRVDLNKGKASANLTINGTKKSVDFTISNDKANYTFASKIDLGEFKMSKSMEALHTACEKLHIGRDGKSVTWPEVGIKIVAAVTETCS
jgi:polyisoprenoid-binding protein YceI